MTCLVLSSEVTLAKLWKLNLGLAGLVSGRLLRKVFDSSPGKRQ